jgi:hypothetical protein
MKHCGYLILACISPVHLSISHEAQTEYLWNFSNSSLSYRMWIHNIKYKSHFIIALHCCWLVLLVVCLYLQSHCRFQAGVQFFRFWIIKFCTLIFVLMCALQLLICIASCCMLCGSLVSHAELCKCVCRFASEWRTGQTFIYLFLFLHTKQIWERMLYRRVL